MHLTERTAIDREVLSKRKHFSSVDGTVTSDNAVAGDNVGIHVEVSASVFDERINFLE